MSTEYPPSGQGTPPPPGYGAGYGPPPGYAPPPGYGSPPGYGPPPYGAPGMAVPVYVSPTPPTNGLAIAALITGILGICGGAPAIAAIICGHIGLSQIKEANGTQSGEGMARAGLIMGYVGLGLWILLLVGYFALFAWFATNAPNLPAYPTATP